MHPELNHKSTSLSTCSSVRNLPPLKITGKHANKEYNTCKNQLKIKSSGPNLRTATRVTDRNMPNADLQINLNYDHYTSPNEGSTSSSQARSKNLVSLKKINRRQNRSSMQEIFNQIKSD